MIPRPPLKLSRLSDIGWSKWDPIGLLGENQLWDHQPFASEYDGYLLEAAGGLRRGWSVEDAALYLLQAEIVHIGMVKCSDSYARAHSTAEAIQSYLKEVDTPQ